MNPSICCITWINIESTSSLFIEGIKRKEDEVVAFLRSLACSMRAFLLMLLFNSHVQEMNLLVQADQPGNQLDTYISKLNTILSQKAAGILQLQNRLAHFQNLLKEHNVLVSSCGR